jgi:hypothetical protein
MMDDLSRVLILLGKGSHPMKIILLLVLGFLNFSVIAQDCIPKNHKINHAQVVTGKGWTMAEARHDFYSKLPMIGLLQTLKVNNTRIKTEKDFTEATKVTSDIFANFDYISSYNCKINDQFAMSAIVPTDKINYLPYQFQSDYDKKLISEIARFEYAKKNCGDQPFTIVWAPGVHDEDIRFKNAKPVISKRLHYHIVCGYNWEVHRKIGRSWYEYSSSNNQYNLFVITKEYFEEYSEHLQLEMIKNAMN